MFSSREKKKWAENYVYIHHCCVEEKPRESGEIVSISDIFSFFRKNKLELVLFQADEKNGNLLGFWGWFYAFLGEVCLSTVFVDFSEIEFFFNFDFLSFWFVWNFTFLSFWISVISILLKFYFSDILIFLKLHFSVILIILKFLTLLTFWFSPGFL